MKRILTLLIAVGAITVAQAQSSRYPSDRNDSRDVILGQGNHQTNTSNRPYENNSRYGYAFSAKERDKEIKRIDRDYDQRIRQVEKDRRLRYSEKEYQVKRLEEQKRYAIRQVWERYNDSRNRDNDRRYDRNDRNDRRW